METIIEEDGSTSNPGSLPSSRNSSAGDLDLVSDADSSVYIPALDVTAETNLLGESDDSDEESEESDHEDLIPSRGQYPVGILSRFEANLMEEDVPERLPAIQTESEENLMIEEQLTEIDHDSPKNGSDTEEKEKKYDLGGGDTEAQEKKYDLGGTYNLGTTPEPPSEKSEKKYDLGSFLKANPHSPSPTKASASQGDEQTHSTKTHPRSGSSIFILHKWINEKDWNAARLYLNPPEGTSNKRLLPSVRHKNEDGETSLHIACRKRAPVDIVKSIIDIGGLESVMAVDTYGESLPLHHACHFNASINVIKLLVYVGGPETVKRKDAIGNLALHWALSKNGTYETIKLLIDIGGKETVNSNNKIGWNALHAANYFSSKFQIVKLLVETGDQSTVNHLNRKGQCALDILYEKNPLDRDSIRIIQDEMGKDKKLMKWIPKGTIDATMAWISRQPQSAREDGFNNPFIQMILNETFVEFKILSIILVDLLAQVLLVVTLSFLVSVKNWFGYKEISFSSLNLLIYTNAWLAVRCLTRMVTTPVHSWVSEFSNCLYAAQAILVSWSITILAYDGIHHEYESALAVVTVGLVWFRSVFVLGDVFYNVAVFAAGLQRVVSKLIGFIVTSSLVVIGFAHMMYTASKWEEQWCLDANLDGTRACRFPSLGDSYYTAFTNFLNPAHFFNDEVYMRENTWHLVLIFSFAAVVELILLSVLIAEVMHSFSESKKGGKKAFWQKRYHSITELSDIYRTIDCSRFFKDEEAKSTSTNNGDTDANPDKIPTTRFVFATAHYEVFPGDFYSFRRWWLQDQKAPNLKTRLSYFLNWASLEEIFIPCRTFERVLSGCAMDGNTYGARMVLYLFFPFMMVLQVICFVLGLISFGYFWPKWMKRSLFSGSVDPYPDSNSTVKRHMDVMHNEVQSIQNTINAEKFAVDNVEYDIKSIRKDLQSMMYLVKKTAHGSVYSEDEFSEILSEGSEAAA